MNILFLHIPKTAGTSIQHAIQTKYGYPKWMRYHSRLSSTLEICKMYSYIPDYSFTVVRDPYDRLVSLFTHTKKQYKEDPISFFLNESSGNKNNPNYEAYLEFMKTDFNSWIKSTFSKKTEFVDLKLMPQSEYIDCDYDIDIFKFEELYKVEEKLKVTLPKLNENLKPNIAWTDESKQIVQNYFKEDFERFDYPI
jgi:hypothetical protein